MSVRVATVLAVVVMVACGPAVTHRSQIIRYDGACREAFGQPYVKMCFFEDPQPRLSLEIAAQNDKHLADPGSYSLEVTRGGAPLFTRALPAVTLTKKGISCTSDGNCQDWDFSAKTEVAVPEIGGWTAGEYVLRFRDRGRGQVVTEVTIKIED